MFNCRTFAASKMDDEGEIVRGNGILAICMRNKEKFLVHDIAYDRLAVCGPCAKRVRGTMRRKWNEISTSDEGANTGDSTAILFWYIFYKFYKTRAFISQCPYSNTGARTHANTIENKYANWVDRIMIFLFLSHQPNNNPVSPSGKKYAHQACYLWSPNSPAWFTFNMSIFCLHLEFLLFF